MSSAAVPLPFAYPDKPHRRRHAPRGYKKYRQYCPWLRDEFTFRCVYCLKREAWNPQLVEWHLDHVIAQANDKTLRNAYDNLVYSCASCNLAKSNERVPDPCKVAFGKHVKVDKQGNITWRQRGDPGHQLIRELGLDNEEYTAMRRRYLKLHKTLQENRDLMREYFGYPENMPDLTKESPTDGNDNAGSELQSFHARRAALPDCY